MSTVSEYFVKAGSILTEKGFEPDRMLRIRDGYIADINDISVSDASVELLDFSAYTVTPCFCDYHLHLFKKEPAKMDEAVKALHTHGITTVFDGGSQDPYSLEINDTVKNSLHIKTAGHAIYKKGGYGTFIGQGIETVREAEQLVDKLTEAGADYIKIINSGIYHPEKNYITEGGFGRNDLRAIADYAKSKGLNAACHANGEQAVDDAVNAGVSFLIHGLYASDTSIEIMKEKGIAFIPTIHAFAGLGNISASKKSRNNIDRAVEHHIKTVRRAYEKGVIILPGSDAGPDFIPYGSSFYEELRMLQKTGMPVDAILSSAVSRQIEKGSHADFLVLDGLDVKKVFNRGKCIVDNT